MQTYLDTPFGDGTYTFRLPLPQITELQRKTGIGIGALYAKLVKGRFQLPREDGSFVPFGDPSQADYALNDVIETIRLALIGGDQGRVNGEDVKVLPVRAQELLELYVYPARPLMEAWDLAVAILAVCIEGWEDPERKKKGAERRRERRAKQAKEKDGLTIQKPSPISPLPDATSSPPAT